MFLLWVSQMVSKSGGYGHKSIFLVYSGIVFVSFCVGFVLIPKQYDSCACRDVGRQWDFV
jgi:hypothetical protein